MKTVQQIQDKIDDLNAEATTLRNLRAKARSDEAKADYDEQIVGLLNGITYLAWVLESN